MTETHQDDNDYGIAERRRTELHEDAKRTEQDRAQVALMARVGLDIAPFPGATLGARVRAALEPKGLGMWAASLIGRARSLAPGETDRTWLRQALVHAQPSADPAESYLTALERLRDRAQHADVIAAIDAEIAQYKIELAAEANRERAEQAEQAAAERAEQAARESAYRAQQEALRAELRAVLLERVGYAQADARAIKREREIRTSARKTMQPDERGFAVLLFEVRERIAAGLDLTDAEIEQRLGR